MASKVVDAQVPQCVKISPDGSMVAYILKFFDPALYVWTRSVVVLCVRSGTSMSVSVPGRPLDLLWRPVSRELAIVCSSQMGTSVSVVDPWQADSLRELSVPVRGRAQLCGWLEGDAILVGMSTSSEASDTDVYAVTGYPYRLEGVGFIGSERQILWALRLDSESLDLLCEANEKMIVGTPTADSVIPFALHSGAYSLIWLFDWQRGASRWLGQSEGLVQWLSGPDVEGKSWFVVQVPPGPNELNQIYYHTQDDGFRCPVELDGRIVVSGLGQTNEVNQTGSGVLVFLQMRNGTSRLVELDFRTGRIEELYGESLSFVRGYSRSPTGEVALNLGSVSQHPEIYYLADGCLTRLTHHGDQLESRHHSTGGTTLITVPPGRGKVEIRGMLTSPLPSHDTGRLYLDIQGGPDVPMRPEYSPFHTYRTELIRQGWHILQLCGSGRDGFGGDLLKRLIGRWGEQDIAEHDDAVTDLVHKGIVKSYGIAVGGYSYGAYLAALLGSRCEWVRAAVCAGGAYELSSWYRTSDIGKAYLRKQMGGSPYEIPEAYRDASPLTHVNEGSSPTLIIHGGADLRDPSFQAHEYFRALLDYGVEAELVLYEQARHLFYYEGPVNYQIDYNERIPQWLERMVPRD